MKTLSLLTTAATVALLGGGAAIGDGAALGAAYANPGSARAAVSASVRIRIVSPSQHPVCRSKEAPHQGHDL